jgi:AcrR family transcriptional regulator
MPLPVEVRSDPGTATRVRLIETAERLFAERGIHGASLREIGAQAGQRNTAAARYHFGSVQGLVEAIFEHRMGPINECRLALLDELDAAGRGHDIDALTEAYLLPLSDCLGEPGQPSWYLRFCVHAAYFVDWASRDLGQHEWTRGMSIVRQRTLDSPALAHLDLPVRAERWSLYGGYMAHALADRELQIQHGLGPHSSRTHFLDDHITTAVALVTTPLSATRRNPRRLP